MVFKRVVVTEVKGYVKLKVTFALNTYDVFVLKAAFIYLSSIRNE